MPSFLRNNGAQSPPESSHVANEKHGSLEYVAQQGQNGSVPTYQEASGAPVEVRSPLGYRVQWFTIIFLNIGQMVGTGVFSTRKSLYQSYMVDRLIITSRKHPESDGLGGFIDDILGHWVHHRLLWAGDIS
jgi:hypothetical protein